MLPPPAGCYWATTPTTVRPPGPREWLDQAPVHLCQELIATASQLDSRTAVPGTVVWSANKPSGVGKHNPTRKEAVRGGDSIDDNLALRRALGIDELMIDHMYVPVPGKDASTNPPWAAKRSSALRTAAILGVFKEVGAFFVCGVELRADDMETLRQVRTGIDQPETGGITGLHLDRGGNVPIFYPIEDRR